MIGPPREMTRGSGGRRKSRTDEITLGVNDLSKGVPHTSQPMYSSFTPKHRNAKFPGYGDKTEVRTPRGRSDSGARAPGPGDVKAFSSFEKASSKYAPRGTNIMGQQRCTFGNTPRRDEWVGNQQSPGVGQYDTEAAPHRHHFGRKKDFRSPNAPPMLQGTGRRPPRESRQMGSRSGSVTRSRRGSSAAGSTYGDDLAPGPATYSKPYSSFAKAAAPSRMGTNQRGHTASTFGNDYGRSSWQGASSAPGVNAYDVKDPRREAMGSKKSFRNPRSASYIAGTSRNRDGRPIHGAVKSVGVVANTHWTNAGPGDYTAPSDFDISRRTFNAYARQQSVLKEQRVLPAQQSRRRSLSGRGSDRGSAYGDDLSAGTPRTPRRRGQSAPGRSPSSRSPGRGSAGRASPSRHVDPMS